MDIELDASIQLENVHVQHLVMDLILMTRLGLYKELMHLTMFLVVCVYKRVSASGEFSRSDEGSLKNLQFIFRFSLDELKIFCKKITLEDTDKAVQVMEFPESGGPTFRSLTKPPNAAMAKYLVTSFKTKVKNALASNHINAESLSIVAKHCAGLTATAAFGFSNEFFNLKSSGLTRIRYIQYILDKML